MKTVKGVVAGAVLALAPFVNAGEPTIQAEQQKLMTGTDRTTISASYEGDDWKAFASTITLENAVSSMEETAAGASFKTGIGEFSIAAERRETDKHFGYDPLVNQAILGVIGYRNGRIAASVGFGEEKGGDEKGFLLLNYQLAPKFEIHGQYQKHITPLEVGMPEQVVGPYPQTHFFGIIPTRADIPGLHWNEEMTANEIGLVYGSDNHNLGVDFTTGKRPFLNIGDEMSFDGFKIGHHSDNDKFYNDVQVELTRSEGLYEGRAFLDVGFQTDRFKTGTTGYLHGKGKDVPSIVEFFGGSGAGLMMQGRIGKWWPGFFATTEEDRRGTKRLDQAGLVLEKNDWRFLGGVARMREAYNRRTEEIGQGPILAIEHEGKKLDIKGIVGDDGTGMFGNIMMIYRMR